MLGHHACFHVHSRRDGVGMISSIVEGSEQGGRGGTWGVGVGWRLGWGDMQCRKEEGGQGERGERDRGKEERGKRKEERGGRLPRPQNPKRVVHPDLNPSFGFTPRKTTRVNQSERCVLYYPPPPPPPLHPTPTPPTPPTAPYPPLPHFITQGRPETPSAGQDEFALT